MTAADTAPSPMCGSCTDPSGTRRLRREFEVLRAIDAVEKASRKGSRAAR